MCQIRIEDAETWPDMCLFSALNLHAWSHFSTVTKGLHWLTVWVIMARVRVRARARARVDRKNPV